MSYLFISLGFSFLNTGYHEVSELSVFDISTVKMPIKAYRYIKNIIDITEYAYKDIVLAIGVFGSISRGTADEFSDVDLLIIYKDNISSKTRNLVYQNLLYLENVYGFRRPRTTFQNAFFYALMQTTGTFKSIFFTSRQAWREQNFIKIFQVNFIARLFVHQTSILNAILPDLKWVWINKTLNYDPTFIIKKEVTFISFNREMVRSFIVTLFLSLGALFITPVSRESTKFSVEAIKWCLLSLFHRKYFNISPPSKGNGTTSDILSWLFKRNPRIYKQILPYFNMRKCYYRSVKLNFLAPFLIFYLFWKVSK